MVKGGKKRGGWGKGRGGVVSKLAVAYRVHIQSYMHTHTPEYSLPWKFTNEEKGVGGMMRSLSFLVLLCI
jgi:hypothetical protein